MNKALNRTLSVAPMMGYTDRHYRFLMRLISPNTLLYSEMITTGAVLQGDTKRYLKFSKNENPVALQLGGCDPQALAQSAVIAEDYGYQEVNLNVGCPSDRVQKGRIGACLMKEPELVAECLAAMMAKVSIPVTLKTRIGVDDQDDSVFFQKFIKTVAQAKCQTFIIHARKAWLKGLSPKQNREIPPLKYDVVYQLKQQLPDREIIINGGIKTLSDIQGHLKYVDGVMLGRVACSHPMLFLDLEEALFGRRESMRLVLQEYIGYMKFELANGVPLRCLIKPLLPLFQGVSGARQWRRKLSECINIHGGESEAPRIILEAVHTLNV